MIFLLNAAVERINVKPINKLFTWWGVLFRAFSLLFGCLKLKLTYIDNDTEICFSSTIRRGQNSGFFNLTKISS